MRHGRRRSGTVCALVAAACAVGFAPWAHGQTPSPSTGVDPQAAKVSAWATGGSSATASPSDSDGKPAGSAPAAGAIPFWQAPPMPSAVIQGGAIPPGWQPQAVPYQGIGPDGRPMTMYFAPTYVFTWQAGPPVLGVPQVGRSQAVGPARPGVPPVNAAGGWNYQTRGATPVPVGLPPATTARYAPQPYQFPTDSRALTGTPIAPPATTPPAPPPQTWGAAPQPATAPNWGTQPYPPPYPQQPYPQQVSGYPPQPPPGWMPPPPPQQPWVPSNVPAPPGVAGPPDPWTSVAPAAAGAAAYGAAATVPPPPPPPVASLPPPIPAVSPPAVPPIPAAAGSSDPLPPDAKASNTHVWKVVAVYDGDTVTCLDENNQQQKIRLAEIDAPEAKQDFGKVSRDALASMVFGRTIHVVDSGRDRYGRWIGRLYVDGIDVNRQMIASGMAWHYADYSKDKSLAAVQAQAQSQRLGIWSQPNPIPPWEYRKNGSKKASA